jgi:hypothetical protein
MQGLDIINWYPLDRNGCQITTIDRQKELFEHRKIVFSSNYTLQQYITDKSKQGSNNITSYVLSILSSSDDGGKTFYKDKIDMKEFLDWLKPCYGKSIIHQIKQKSPYAHLDNADYNIVSNISQYITEQNFYLLKWILTDLFEKQDSINIINQMLTCNHETKYTNSSGQNTYPFRYYYMIKYFYDMSLENSKIIFNKQLIFNNYFLIQYNPIDKIKIIKWLYELGDINICDKIQYNNKSLCLISIISDYEVLKYFYTIYEQLNIVYDYETDEHVFTQQTNQLLLFMHSSLKAEKQAERRIKLLEEQNKIIPELFESIKKLSNRLDKIEQENLLL